MSFSLDRNSQIVIYGTSAMAVKWVEKAESIGLNILLFLDKNADSIRKIGRYPVIRLEDWEIESTSDIVVIIMLQNIMQHYQIVQSLWNKNIEKIIYFPIKSWGLNLMSVSTIRNKYNDCIKFQFENVLDAIPDYADLVSFNMLLSSEFLYENKEDAVFWAPIELCYTEKKKSNGLWQSDYTEEAEMLLDTYIRGRNLFSIQPYHDLFNYLNGSQTDCELYLKIFGREGHISYANYNNDSILADRNSLYNLYVREINTGGSKFFEESPANVEADTTGKLIIKDGVHRSLFLMIQGYQWIPVRMAKRELGFLGEERYIERLEKYIKKKKLTELEWPVEHPHFWKFPVNRLNLTNLWGELSKLILEQNIKIQSVADVSLTNGYFSRNFVRLGSQTISCFCENEVELTEIENHIFRMEFIKTTDDVRQAVEKKDIVIANASVMDNLSILVNLKETQTICFFDVPLAQSSEMLKKFSRKKIQLITRYTINGKQYGMFLLL